jgi:hypothetical protein
MDEILQHLQTRLVEGAPAPERTQPDMSFTRAPARADDYADAVERIMLLLREAQELRILLGSEAVRALTQSEHDDLLRQLGKVLQELWSCEASLHRPAPLE